ncbi:MAG TPA: hypothetical protein VMC09_00090 [Anaerolineales bacterium]|nr:hypothetical protein [Anaerolineales bacterium]
MSDLFETVKGGQDIFKKLLSYIPGFNGYVERTNRRAADKLLRDQVALKYTDLASRASRLEKDLADAGQMDFIDDLESVGLKLRTFADRIKNASYGYSGFFDTVKINENELAKIYTFDTAFFVLGDQISGALDNIAAAVGSDGVKATIRAANDLALQAGQNYDQRYQAITGSGAPQA